MATCTKEYNKLEEIQRQAAELSNKMKHLKEKVCEDRERKRKQFEEEIQGYEEDIKEKKSKLHHVNMQLEEHEQTHDAKQDAELKELKDRQKLVEDRQKLVEQKLSLLETWEVEEARIDTLYVCWPTLSQIKRDELKTLFVGEEKHWQLLPPFNAMNPEWGRNKFLQLVNSLWHDSKLIHTTVFDKKETLIWVLLGAPEQGNVSMRIFISKKLLRDIEEITDVLLTKKQYAKGTGSEESDEEEQEDDKTTEAKKLSLQIYNDVLSGKISIEAWQKKNNINTADDVVALFTRVAKGEGKIILGNVVLKEGKIADVSQDCVVCFEGNQLFFVGLNVREIRRLK